MRTIEIILLVANLLSLLSLAIPLPLTMRWMHYLIPITVIIFIVQIIVEGSRWQLMFLYALTIAFFTVWLFQIALPDAVHISRFVKGTAIVLSLSGILLSFALAIALPVFHFPKPSGMYAIGTISYHWVDTTRPELFTIEQNDHREIIAQVWYPAKIGASGTYAPYMQDAELLSSVLAKLVHLPQFVFSHFKYVTSNAILSAPIAEDESSYPVLIFLSGLDGFRASNTFQIEELVSHGYIVVGIEQPGASAIVRFPDGQQLSGWLRDDMQPLIEQSIAPKLEAPTLYGELLDNGIIPYFAQDLSFTLDELSKLNQDDPYHILTGRLDFNHVGTFGVSLGGINVAQACLQDSRLKACLIMDAPIPYDVVAAGLQQPCMIITRDADTMRLEHERAGGWSEYDIQQHQTTMRGLYNNLSNDGYYLQISDIFHLNFTDFPYWSPITSQLGLSGSIHAQRAFDIINAYSLAFFDKHLKNQVSPLLNGNSKLYPEVNFETRHD